MGFSDKFKTVSDILSKNYNINIYEKNYDGYIVKQLSESNCIRKGITSHQSHIAITGEQMELFPYIYSKKYIENDDQSMKNFFVFKAPVNIYKSNCDIISTGYIDFGSAEVLKEEMCVYPRSGGSQIQLSMKQNGDSLNFIKFRELIEPLDYLVLLKKSEVLEYDAFIVQQKYLDSNSFKSVFEKYRNSTKSVTFVGYNDMETNTPVEFIRPCQKIFFGAPGTGKSYGIDMLISNHYPNVNIEDNPFVFRTTVYSDYSYYNFIGNIMPTSKDGEIGYEFKAGVFTQALEMAFEHSDKEIFLVIEEMSRGDIASIFGDIFQLLDRDDSGISDYSINNDLVSNYLNEKNIDIGEKIYLPRNLHIIGTVNTSDQNVNVIDTAFKRRFEFVYVDVNPVKDDNDNFLNSFKFKLDDTEFEWNKFYMSLNELITTKLELSEDKQIGQFFIKFNNLVTDEQKLDEIKNKLLHYLWDDVQGAVISDECSIFKNEYKTFSSLYKAFGNGENVFSSELMTIYTNKSI